MQSTIGQGSRVERVRGTSIEGLIGTVALVSQSINNPDVATALVWLDDPEPGIGHQFVCPLTDLAVVPEEWTDGDWSDLAIAAEDYRHDEREDS